MADQVSTPGYAVLAQGQSVKRDDGMHWGGGAAWILVWVVVIIIVIAILAALFCGGNRWFDNKSSSDDDRNKKDDCFNFSWLGGLVVFIVVILFLCWLLGAAGGRNY
jgi:heme/copper-type cytochrome/quinol oxidase subunit 2